MERHEFQAETKQLLDLMINSIYSNKDIFLRELISNSSDAIDKLRHQALTDESLRQFVGSPEIRIEINQRARTLKISDNGIGMTRQEVIDYIGTIAKSGTKEFIAKLKEQNNKEDLIGQFGVGLYASFMVADKVDLITRHASEEGATYWSSIGDGTYTIGEDSRDTPGTTVVLYLKHPEYEEDFIDYTVDAKIREIIKKYSNYISYPIILPVEKIEFEKDEDGNHIEGSEGKKVLEDEIINSQKAIWRKTDAETSPQELNDFYKHISNDWQNPLHHIRVKAEGTFEFKGLLFIPKEYPSEAFSRNREKGIHLYIKKIFIMNDCHELIPEYLRFIKGVIDSEDLSLNISREILQQNRYIKIIKKYITNKIVDELRILKRDRFSEYLSFWNEFGQILKEGIHQDQDNRNKLLELALFQTSKSNGELVSLQEYASRMQPEQKTIFFITGKNKAILPLTPQLESFKENDIEVLLLADPIDHIWTQWEMSFQEFPLISINQAQNEEIKKINKNNEQKTEEETIPEENLQPLFDKIFEHLKDYVKKINSSQRLTRSLACLVGEKGDMTPDVEELIRAAGRSLPPVKRILEINPKHGIIKKLYENIDNEDINWNTYAHIIYGQALLAEGHNPINPCAFADMISNITEKSLK